MTAKRVETLLLKVQKFNRYEKKNVNAQSNAYLSSSSDLERVSAASPSSSPSSSSSSSSPSSSSPDCRPQHAIDHNIKNPWLCTYFLKQNKPKQKQLRRTELCEIGRLEFDRLGSRAFVVGNTEHHLGHSQSAAEVDNAQTAKR